MLRRRVAASFAPQATVAGGVAAIAWSFARCSMDATGTLKSSTNSLRRISAPGRYAAGCSAMGLGLSIRAHSTSTPSLSTSSTRSLPASPHQCSIEQVLLPSVQTSGSGIRTETLRGMVQLLLDPDATDVEDVSMLDFVVMVPKRQMIALHGRKERLDVVLGSERYQACKDARALRLAGITTVGRWDENRDRVPISAYSRGLMEEAYAAMARNPVETQKNQVITWLTKTIQKAIIEEFAANKGNRQFLAPLITGMQALPETAAAASSAANAAAMIERDETHPQGEEEEEVRKKRTEDVNATASAAVEEERGTHSNAKTNKSARVRGRKHARHVGPMEEGTEKAGGSTAAATGEDVRRSDKSHPTVVAAEDEEDAEIARLLQETEQEFAPTPYIRGSAHDKGAAGESAASASTSGTTAKADVEDAKPVKLKKKKVADTANKSAEGGEHQHEEKVTAVTEANTSLPDSKQNRSLARLAELMLIQFNSADGYLHLPDIKDDEKKGFVIAIDGDCAQVDPFALYSTFGAAKLTGGEPAAITALHQVWAAYSAYIEANEVAEDDATAKFFKEKGVEALVHGAVLLRAISREQAITLVPQDIPTYGFPLLSSDRRPHRTRRSKTATDMTADKVCDAVKAYSAFFATKSKKFTPIRPTIDYNSGCSVAALMGTTLHLYETSLKETVREEDIRCRFGEAMLGILHVVEKKVIARVNVVHYHILATSISGGSGGAGGVDGMTTSIVSVDITGPFTASEKTRLLQLAEPLGMADAIAACTCVSDIVDNIETLGVSVVHDILTNRDDLEALLTPTLVQLLPEAEEEEEEEEEQETEKKPSTRRAPAPVVPAAKDTSSKPGSYGGNTAAGAKVAATAADEEEEEEEEEEVHSVDAVGEDEVEEEEEETEEDDEVKPAKGGKQKTAAAKHRAVTVEEEDDDEEAVDEEEEEEEEDKKMKNEAAEGDDDDDEKEAEDEDEDEDEDDEEEEAPRAAAACRKQSAPALVKARSARGRVQQAEGAKKTREEEGIEEAPRQQPHQRTPSPKKTTHAGKRAPPPPPAAAEDDDDDDALEDDEEEEVQPPAPPQHNAASKKGYAMKKPAPPPPASADNDDEEEEEEVARRPMKKGMGLRRAPPPPVSAGNDESMEDEEDEVVAAPRARNRGRRMNRALPNPTTITTDEDRWFQKARR
ncbi:putative glutamic acid rich protein [Trypanosoma rangeli]|uniref:Putative glutamic acid rich protein n=1 Tax=Trypanosoma rangeli TaxID=5698 RepID=A0A3R7KLQ3_TRYRA|nr:putative glutamic acid rich protein [Trypanosoma rangeli]RNF09963.1 putative glutamic acid rich protein [Trypanosoma rangeli]|eukprot:RNF09963.1 putative glutamic acid rich protein [Trypanosoma rangeli]